MIDILVPFEQEGTKAIVRSWLKQVGDAVTENDPLVELETDKVTQEVPSPGTGILEEIILSSDAEAVPGALLGRLRVAKGEEAVPESSGASAALVAEAPAPAARVECTQALSPAVRRAVRQHDIDPNSIAGSGRGGRITRADVDAAIEARQAQPQPASPPPAAVAKAAPVRTQASARQQQPASPPRSYDIPHDRMRRLIADNMLNSVTTAPHVTAVFEADFSAIIAHRKAQKAAFAKEGINLTFTAYIVSACADAMRAAPAINSRWHEDRLELFEDINIGVGTALGEKGLIVPVVHRVQDLSLTGIAARIQDLIGRARTNQLKPADVQSGTFSISNHGVSGSLIATPIIINQPQSAILGVGKLEKRVVVREVGGVDTIQIRPMCYVSLTIDHRVVDGHQTNSWLTTFVEAIENWPPPV